MTPPTRFSRHRFTLGVYDPEGRSFLTERVPYGYRDLPDNRFHVVAEGDTLWSLAALYFEGVDRAAGLWWVVADFQPEPVVDPTIALVPGSIVVVPSLEVLQTQVLNEARRRVSEDEQLASAGAA